MNSEACHNRQQTLLRLKTEGEKKSSAHWASFLAGDDVMESQND